MEQNNSETTEVVKDRDAEGDASATSPVGSLKKSSEMSGDNFSKTEGSYSSDSDESDLELEYECTLCKKKFSGIKPLRQHQKSGKHLKTLQRIKLQREMDQESNTRDSDEESALFKDKTYAECDVCKKKFTGVESYRQHLMSSAHKKKISYRKLLDQAKEDGNVNMEKLSQLIEREDKKSQASAAFETDDDVEDDLKCIDCEKAFTGLESFYDHMRSKTHKKILKQKELISKLITGTTSGNISGIEVKEEDIVCKLCSFSFNGPENVTAHLKSKRHSKAQEEHLKKKVLKERKKDKGQDGKTEEAHESAQASIESEKDFKEIKENTLLCYSKYKNYKEVMKDAQSTQMD